MDKLTSELFDLRQIIEKDLRFNIPRYQRLYVWENEQVKTLFHDIHAASKNKRSLYYLGGIIIVKRQDDDQYYDLVDGQQRFTTLWLLANELGTPLNDFTTINGDLRLEFSIRETVKAYLRGLLNSVTLENENQQEEDEDLVRIDKAKRTLNMLIRENLKSADEKEAFVKYLRNAVKVVITKVPEQTDLNKLFETLNNRGEQLAQHEILKARLLSKIRFGTKRYTYYSLLWNACSDMYNYFEQALAHEVGNAKEVANIYDKNQERYCRKALRSMSAEGGNTARRPLRLSEIVRRRSRDENELGGDAADELGTEFHPLSNDDEFQRVRSILTFPQLLLHTLRIHLYRCDRGDIQRINEKELLSTFSEYLPPEESTDFIDLLFEIRECFDKYIIKWVDIENGKEDHLIKKLLKQNQKKGGWSYYLRRETTSQYDGMALLQSILYHSQQNTTQYWLSPYLNRLLDHPTFDDAFHQLKKLDNVLFCTDREDELLTNRTWECMEEYPDISPVCEILEQALGTHFPHYWFYKIEFMLWHERNKLGKPEWDTYKMTARNSIEHISPQNPREPNDQLCKTFLHQMGNLVLVTRSINSEYSDHTFKVKGAKFIDKKNKGSYDSLKSDLIYSHECWNDDLADKHQKEIISLMESYFKETMN